MGRAHTPQLLQAYITFTNTYINTSHTTVGLGGRLPIEAQLTQLGLKNSRKGHRAPRNVLHVFSPAQEPTLVFFQGLVCPVWRAAIGGFGGLRLGLQGAGLAALTRATRGILR